MVLVALLASVALAPQAAWANATAMPSGQYLSLNNRHVWLYTNTTDTVIDNGPTLYGESCDPDTEMAIEAACGDCNYAPAGSDPLTGQPTWTSPTTKFTYGRCVGAAILDINHVITRVDAVLIHGFAPSYVYHAAVYKEWYNLGLLQQRTLAVAYPPQATSGEPSCAYDAEFYLSRCDSLMMTLDMEDGGPSMYDLYCSRVTLYATNPVPPTLPMVAVTTWACDSV